MKSGAEYLAQHPGWKTRKTKRIKVTRKGVCNCEAWPFCEHAPNAEKHMYGLTKADWAEIYYALNSKEISPTCAGRDRESVEWRKHLREIMRKIGPDGRNMVTP